MLYDPIQGQGQAVSFTHCLVTHLSASDLFSTTVLYKFIYLLTYLLTYLLKLEILPFSKSISSGIFNVSWQMTTDSETMEQVTISKFCTDQIFDICPSFLCHVTTNLEQYLD